MNGSVQKVKEKDKTAKGKADAVPAGSPLLSLSVGGKKKTVPIVKLTDDEYVAALQEECEASDKPVKVCLTPLLGLEDKDRWGTLDFIATLPNCRISVDDLLHNDLFEAVLKLSVNAADIPQVRCWKLAALEAAVIRYPDALTWHAVGYRTGCAS